MFSPVIKLPSQQNYNCKLIVLPFNLPVITVIKTEILSTKHRIKVKKNQNSCPRFLKAQLYAVGDQKTAKIQFIS